RTQGDGSFWLQMGYFSTLIEVSAWLKLMKRTYPRAFATEAYLDTSRIPTLKAASPEAAGGSSATGLQKVPKFIASERSTQMPDRVSASNPELTDAEVLKLLEARRAGDGVIADEIGAAIAVLPPEDTHTRLVLKEAVAHNAPVAFAVQLQWSVQAIDVKR